MKTINYRCPLCQQALQTNPSGLVCDNKHQFDRAKEGYVNLLPVQHKHSKMPGDSQSMVMARRAFLANGHYANLQQTLIETIESYLTAGQQSIIDSGCGEGYYTNQLAEQLNIKHSDTTIYGIDIAKPAIKYAAKRAKNAHFAVASSAKMPFDDNSANIIFKVFAPTSIEQVKRVLAKYGYFVSVVPGPHHLYELKQRIYSQPKQHQAEQVPNGFSCIDSTGVRQKLCLEEHSDISNLADMTPFAWKLSTEKRQALLNSAPFEVTTDFTINVYRQEE